MGLNHPSRETMAAARGAAALLLPALAAAQGMAVIGYTSFEEPPTVVGLQANVAVGPYYDRRSGAADHELRAERGQNPVAYVACSAIPDGSVQAELGFRTFYVRTREEDDSFSSAPGMMDGARIGVIGDTTTDMHGDNGQGGPAPDGSQYFALEDTDGFVYVEMDPVAVGDYSGIMMSGWVKIEATSWEEDDRVRIWAELADPAAPTGLEVTLLDVHDVDEGQNVTEDVWRQYSAPLPRLGRTTTVTMRFGLDAESSAEEAWFDWFRVLGLGPDRRGQFCSGCGSNTYRMAGSNMCTDCAPGRVSAAGAASCAACEEGKFASPGPFGGCSDCRPSDPNMGVTSPPGSASFSDCRPIPRVIGYTSFEEATITGGTTVRAYHDPLGGDGDHYLPLLADQNPVGYTACSAARLEGTQAELGFRTFYVDTGEGGVADGAKIGVIGDALTSMRGDVGQGGVAPHGSQYFALEDTDGFIFVEMDAVTVADFSGLRMSAWAHFESTTWEETDRVKMWAEGSPSGQEVILVEGTELDSALTGVTVGTIV